MCIRDSVIAVSDLQVEPMNRMRQRFPEIEYAVRDYREMFTMNLDAVVIATPPATHHANHAARKNATAKIPVTNVQTNASLRRAAQLQAGMCIFHQFDSVAVGVVDPCL